MASSGVKDGSWISADARSGAEWSTHVGHPRRLKPKVWRAAFDADGRLSKITPVLRAIADGGVDHSIRGEVWEFLLGAFSVASTAEERFFVRAARRERYRLLLQQCQRMHPAVGSGSLAFPAGSRVTVEDLMASASASAAASASARSPAVPGGGLPAGQQGGSAAAEGFAAGGRGEAAGPPPAAASAQGRQLPAAAPAAEGGRGRSGGASEGGSGAMPAGGSGEWDHVPRGSLGRGSMDRSTLSVSLSVSLSAQLRLDLLMEEGGPKLHLQAGSGGAAACAPESEAAAGVEDREEECADDAERAEGDGDSQGRQPRSPLSAAGVAAASGAEASAAASGLPGADAAAGAAAGELKAKWARQRQRKAQLLAAAQEEDEQRRRGRAHEGGEWQAGRLGGELLDPRDRPAETAGGEGRSASSCEQRQGKQGAHLSPAIGRQSAAAGDSSAARGTALSLAERRGALVAPLREGAGRAAGGEALQAPRVEEGEPWPAGMEGRGSPHQAEWGSPGASAGGSASSTEEGGRGCSGTSDTDDFPGAATGDGGEQRLSGRSSFGSRRASREQRTAEEAAVGAVEGSPPAQALLGAAQAAASAPPSATEASSGGEPARGRKGSAGQPGEGHRWQGDASGAGNAEGRGTSSQGSRGQGSPTGGRKQWQGKWRGGGKEGGGGGWGRRMLKKTRTEQARAGSHLNRVMVKVDSGTQEKGWPWARDREVEGRQAHGGAEEAFEARGTAGEPRTLRKQLSDRGGARWGTGAAAGAGGGAAEGEQPVAGRGGGAQGEQPPGAAAAQPPEDSGWGRRFLPLSFRQAGAGAGASGREGEGEEGGLASRHSFRVGRSKGGAEEGRGSHGSGGAACSSTSATGAAGSAATVPTEALADTGREAGGKGVTAEEQAVDAPLARLQEQRAEPRARGQQWSEEEQRGTLAAREGGRARPPGAVRAAGSRNGGPTGAEGRGAADQPTTLRQFLQRRKAKGHTPSAEEVWRWILGGEEAEEAGGAARVPTEGQVPGEERRGAARARDEGRSQGAEEGGAALQVTNALRSGGSLDAWGRGEAGGAESGQEAGGAAGEGGEAEAVPLAVPESRVAEWLWTLLRITKDVERTDRHLAFFAAEGNRAAMADVLALHAWIDPGTGFCQGMCDILSPFLMLFPDAADAFWCFECLFSKLRLNFLTEGPVGVLRQLAALRSVMAVVDAELAAHLELLGADNYMFAFRMLLVLFRRELPLADVILMWEMMWAADFDSRSAAAFLHRPPEGLNLHAGAASWPLGLPAPLSPPPDAPPAFPRDGAASCAAASAASSSSGADAEASPSPLPSPSTPSASLRRSLWRVPLASSSAAGPEPALWGIGVGVEPGAGWGQLRSDGGCAGLPVFCVAAILKSNRRALLAVEEPDEAMKLFNDVELTLDAAACVQLAVKLRAKYNRRSQRHG